MPLNRRQFLKRSAGAVTVSVVLPKLWLAEAQGQTPEAASRKIFVVIQLAGGNDGLNTVIPYSDDRYHSLRPRIGFQDSELTNTIINNQLALHPSMTALKGLYDAGKVAIVLGVGYANSSLSHFTGMDIWQTADPANPETDGTGWLGRYAGETLAGQSGLSAASVGGTLPKTFFSDKVVIPNITSFAAYDFLVDPAHAPGRANQLAVFNAAYSRSFDAGTFIGALTSTGADAVNGAAQIKNAVATYSSSVTYPNSGFASALKMVAQIVTTIPQANLLYVSIGGFDDHSQQVAMVNGQISRTTGEHATLLQQLSEGIAAFSQDLTAHNLADNTVMMTWSEFGRRVGDNASNGTDHGTAGPHFIVGNPVKGGLYGQQPSLAVTDLDTAGNMKYQVDFREMYATILDKWLGVDSSTVLGSKFGDVGFMG
jgi:uncharacterized protein (DUF1501 family)